MGLRVVLVDILKQVGGAVGGWGGGSVCGCVPVCVEGVCVGVVEWWCCACTHAPRAPLRTPPPPSLGLAPPLALLHPRHRGGLTHL